MKSQLKKLTVLAILLGWLAGCALPPPAPPSPTSFACNGRFSVRYQEAQGVHHRIRNVYGRFAWRDDGKVATLRLLNPLGQTLAVVQLSALGAALELPNRPTLIADNADELMRTALGFPLPVSGLRHWLRAPEGWEPNLNQSAFQKAMHKTLAQIRHSPTERPLQIRQEGWTVDYLSYTEAPVVRVQRMNLTRDDASIEVKLALEPGS
ncbi:outer membrane lipoprotein LolB [Mycoavidus sp. B2-EB]|uniref:outer membrane lipoprotein LolB n=1 Tax=Mycoavidus sp. B2-EB TaxID=2651972 RepID=UPI001628AD45|nr:outer membrane lipoprotein LolB [Mycoavidus sp. B2-EB]BBO59446.1 outer-membrane lipoprotein LolB [Mycoavidus sp. B2-EB]